MTDTILLHEFSCEPSTKPIGLEPMEFPFSHDTNVALGNSSEAHIPAAPGEAPQTAVVALIGNDTDSVSCTQETDPQSACLHAITTLTKTDLRRRYPREASSHRHMLEREKDLGRVIHPEFRKFSDFLRHVGPLPVGRATLDRINNTDREYGPGKVRWADKPTQNSNKGNTRSFHCSRTGADYSVRELAKLQGVSAAAIRKRAERDVWSHDQIIAGKRLPPEPKTIYVKVATPDPEPTQTPPLEGIWHTVMEAVRPGECHTLMAKERGMLDGFAKLCSSSGLAYQAEDIFRHVLDHWAAYATLLQNDHGVYRPPSVPAIATLAAHPRAAVNLWLRDSRLELRDGAPLPIAAAIPNVKSATIEKKKPVARHTRWDNRSWKEVRLYSFQEWCALQGPLQKQLGGDPEMHALELMYDWRDYGHPIVRDMPQWAIDIISKRSQTFADDLLLLIERDAERERPEPAPPEPAPTYDPRDDL